MAFDHTFPFSNMHLYQYVQKASTYEILYRVSGDTPPDDAALAGKGAAVIGKIDKGPVPKLTNAVFPPLIQHATHAQLEKELGFPLLPVDPGPSNLSRRSSDDSLSSPTSQPGKWDASDLIHVVDQIYDAESSGNSIDGSMLYNDIGETAQLAARLTDEPSTHYIGESSGSFFTRGHCAIRLRLSFHTALKFLGILERIGKDCDANRVTKLRTSVPWSNESWFKSLFQYDNHRSQGAEYPGDDLVHLLIDLFFRHVNPVFPVIHEPTFRARISEYLHLRDERFGYLLLSVLTVASLYSTDERAFEEVDGIKIPGHRFFSQIKDWDKKLAPAVLTGLQAGFVSSVRLVLGMTSDLTQYLSY